MATSTVSNTYTLSDGTQVTITHRLTYTISEHPNYCNITCTKLETKASASNKVGLVAGDIFISYYDSSGSWRYEDSGLDRNYCSPTPSYQTRWAGSKTFTSYRQQYVTTFYFDGNIAVSIPTLQSYEITFSAPGASPIPDPLYKYYGIAKNLPTGKPNKTGYTFVNWKATNGAYYLPGTLYTDDASTTMTAQWTTNQYTISYNANGGIGSVASQIKTYDDPVPIYFQDGSTLYKKETVEGVVREYELLEWNTNPDRSGVSYNINSEIPNISNNLRVYAIWGLKYFYPYISDLQDYRTSTPALSDKERSNNGEYIYISFDFIGYSDDAGLTYKVPNCAIIIDEDEYNPTLHFDENTNTGHVEFKPNVRYSMDNPHNIIVELSDPEYVDSNYKIYDYITTSVYPIDLLDNPETNKVYMGIMRPYKEGKILSLPDIYISGAMTFELRVDANASKTTDAVSGEDKDLFNAIRKLGWYDDVIE